MRWQTNLHSIGHYDAIVCGGGPAGTCAALAARRSGLRVLLIEAEAQLGGMGTSGLVSHWLGGRHDDGRWVVGGIFRELSERGAKAGIALLPVADDDPYPPHGWYRGLMHGVPFDPFAVARLYDDVMAEAGVAVLLKTTFVDTVVSGDHIDLIVLHNKSGLQAVSADVFIDATGDADVAARSGCATQLGREDDRRMTPVTLQVHMDRIDRAALAAYIHAHKAPRLREEIQRWAAEGDWPFEWNRFISVALTDDDTFMVNSSRVTGVDGTDGRSVSDGIVRGRRETYQLLDIMRRRVPGCAHARTKAIASQLGVRETRRLIGDYVLTVEDVVSGKAFDDAIGFSSYGWDLPDPKKPSHQPLHERGVKKPPLTPIPYRIMVPRPIANLVCPGRAVSVERHVLGPLRVMAPCMAMGEAAGVAAAQVIGRARAFREADAATLRSELRKRGAIVDRDFA